MIRPWARYVRRRVFCKVRWLNCEIECTTRYKDRTYGSLLHNNALDDQVFNVNALCVRIRFRIFQKASDKLDRLLWPTSCIFTRQSIQSRDRTKRTRTPRGLELFRLASTTNTTCKPPKRDNLFVVLDIAEVGICLGQFETWDTIYVSAHFAAPNFH